MITKVINKYIFAKNVGFLSTIILTTLIQARAYLKNFFYGDPFDGRLMIVLHEHWWHFLAGRRPFLDTYFFYPYDRGLGFSDTFLLQGFSYSAARFFDFDLVDSWALATISILILSNIGLTLLAKQLLNNFYLQMSFILITGSSFTYFAFLNMYTNVAGYGLVSFLALFFIKLFSIKSSPRDQNIGFIGISISFPILLLSAWYAAFFSAVYIFIFFLVCQLFGKHLKVNFINKISYFFTNIRKSIVIFSISIFSLLTALWLYIYLPSASDVDRDLQELIEGSPKFSQLANGSALGGGLFQKLYEFLGYQNFNSLIQDQNGLTLSLFISWIILGMYFFSSKSLTKLDLVWARYVWIISTLQLFIFLQIGNFSVFQIFWQLISPLSAIRVPARMLILFSAIIILLLHVVIDKLVPINLKSRNAIVRTLLVLILPIVFIDQIRFQTVTWGKQDYESKNLISQQEIIKQTCDYFVLNNPGGWWSNQISAMYLSAQINIPTANGYSGGFPAGYPVKDWHYEGGMSDLLNWTSFAQNSVRGCIVSETHEVITSLKEESKIIFRSGFSPEESDSKGNVWRWAESSSGQIILKIPSEQEKIELTFQIKYSECTNNVPFKIYREPDILIYSGILNASKESITLPLENNLTTITELRFEAKGKYCTFENDPRNLYFEISNYGVT